VPVDSVAEKRTDNGEVGKENAGVKRGTRMIILQMKKTCSG
jgi:hypothetical protein